MICFLLCFAVFQVGHTLFVRGRTSFIYPLISCNFFFSPCWWHSLKASNFFVLVKICVCFYLCICVLVHLYVCKCMHFYLLAAWLRYDDFFTLFTTNNLWFVVLRWLLPKNSPVQAIVMPLLLESHLFWTMNNATLILLIRTKVCKSSLF